MDDDEIGYGETSIICRHDLFFFFATKAARLCELLDLSFRSCSKFPTLKSLPGQPEDSVPPIREHEQDFHLHPESSARSKHHFIGEQVTRESKTTVQANYIPDKLVSMYRKAP